jgi:hypothetical protein
MTMQQRILGHPASKVIMAGATAVTMISYAAAGDLPKEGTFTLTSYFPRRMGYD